MDIMWKVANDFMPLGAKLVILACLGLILMSVKFEMRILSRIMFMS